MKPVRLTLHAREQCEERGAREAAKRGRFMYRQNFQYDAAWQGKLYAIKQVAPVVVEPQNEIIVVTVYTFYF